MKATATTEIKTIKVFPFVGNNTERNREIRKAQAYTNSIAEAKAERKQKLNAKLEFATYVIAILAIIGLVIAIIAKALAGANEYSFYKKTDVMQPNGNYYIHVTERPCEVTEIDNNVLTVEYKGKSYTYNYGNTVPYEVGDKIACQFNDDGKIIEVNKY